MLAGDEAEAVVRADYDKNQVIVWVRGPYADARRDLLTVVRDHFRNAGQIKGVESPGVGNGARTPGGDGALR